MFILLIRLLSIAMRVKVNFATLSNDLDIKGVLCKRELDEIKLSSIMFDTESCSFYQTKKKLRYLTLFFDI